MREKYRVHHQSRGGLVGWLAGRHLIPRTDTQPHTAKNPDPRLLKPNPNPALYLKSKFDDHNSHSSKSRDPKECERAGLTRTTDCSQAIFSTDKFASHCGCDGGILLTRNNWLSHEAQAIGCILPQYIGGVAMLAMQASRRLAPSRQLTSIVLRGYQRSV